jgi:hypothetical protein
MLLPGFAVLRLELLRHGGGLLLPRLTLLHGFDLLQPVNDCCASAESCCQQ